MKKTVSLIIEQELDDFLNGENVDICEPHFFH